MVMIQVSSSMHHFELAALESSDVFHLRMRFRDGSEVDLESQFVDDIVTSIRLVLLLVR